MLKALPLSSLVKVFSDEEPKAKPFKEMSLFKNERASAQVAICSDCDCEISVGIKSPLQDSVNLVVVEEIYSGMAIARSQDDYVLRRDSGYFPELLRPYCGAVKLSAGKWMAIWLELFSEQGLPVGKHDLQVVLKSQDGEEIIQFHFDVIDALLPKQELIYTNWFHTDCLSTYYGVKVFSEEYWRICENYLKAAREHGMNMVLTPLFTPPLDTKKGKERPTVQLIGVECKDGGYAFDFSNLDRWIDTCRKVGIEYFEMAHFFTQWGAKRCPKIVASENGAEKKIFGWKTRASGKKYREFLSALAPELKAYLNKKGIADKTYFHVSDEPMKIMLKSYRKASDIVKQLFPEFQIIDALSSFDFFEKGLVKLPIPATDHIEPFIGKVPQLWTYYCSAQSKEVSNRYFSMPSQRNRIIGYQLYKFDVKGFLHWGYNFWYKRLSMGEVDPFSETDAGGFFPSGDSYVVYPDKDGKPLLSLRLKVFYDGLQDMRALKLAQSLVGREKTMEVLEKGIEKIRFDKYPHSDEWQLECRERINALCVSAIKNENKV